MTVVDVERRNRMLVTLWAYAYEIESFSFVSDLHYDEVCREIDTSIKTGNEILDEFFRTKFDPTTGLWIHEHPELDKVERLYRKVKKIYDKKN